MSWCLPVAAAVGAINDVVFIAYDLWNLPSLGSSGVFVPYLAVKTAHFLACLCCFLSPRLVGHFTPTNLFKLNFTLFLFALCALHVEAGLLTALGDGFASPNHVYRVIIYFLAACAVLELWFLNTCIAAFVAFAPLLVLPVTFWWAMPTSWEASHGSFGRFYAALFTISMLYIASMLRSGWLASQSINAERQTCARLVTQAAKAQALLETAVPRSIARALLSKVHVEELTRSFESASIAFIALTDFEDRAVTLGPHELILWLDSIYSVFDCLVDLYGEAINKIETVGNVYLVSAGLPLEDSEHHVALASFCADVLDLCSNIGGDKVNVKIGLHCGPVTAGIIGETRRFYRIFGDTVNVASRMMSTGGLNRIHCTAAMAALVKDQTKLGFSVTFRGSTFVKGKGYMETFWIQRNTEGETQSELSSAVRTVATMTAEIEPNRAAARLNAILRADTEFCGISSNRSLSEDVAPQLHISSVAAAPKISDAMTRRSPASGSESVREVSSLFSVSPRSRLSPAFFVSTENAKTLITSSSLAVDNVASLSRVKSLEARGFAAEASTDRVQHSGTAMQRSHSFALPAISQVPSLVDASSNSPTTPPDLATAADIYLRRVTLGASKRLHNMPRLQQTVASAREHPPLTSDQLRNDSARRRGRTSPTLGSVMHVADTTGSQNAASLISVPSLNAGARSKATPEADSDKEGDPLLVTCIDQKMSASDDVVACFGLSPKHSPEMSPTNGILSPKCPDIISSHSDVSNRSPYLRKKRLSTVNLLQSAGVSFPALDSPARRQFFRLSSTASDTRFQDNVEASILLSAGSFSAAAMTLSHPASHHSLGLRRNSAVLPSAAPVDPILAQSLDKEAATEPAEDSMAASMRGAASRRRRHSLADGLVCSDSRNLRRRSSLASVILSSPLSVLGENLEYKAPPSQVRSLSLPTSEELMHVARHHDACADSDPAYSPKRTRSHFSLKGEDNSTQQCARTGPDIAASAAFACSGPAREPMHPNLRSEVEVEEVASIESERDDGMSVCCRSICRAFEALRAVPRFEDSNLEREAICRLDNQTVSAALFVFVSFALVCLSSCLTVLLTLSDSNAVGVGPVLIFFATIFVVLAWTLRYWHTERTIYVIGGIAVLATAVAVSVSLVGVVKPVWSLVVIHGGQDSHAGDVLFLQLPSIVALHVSAFTSLRYSFTRIVAFISVLCGLPLAYIVGFVYNDWIVSTWFMFQLLLAAVATTGGSFVSEFRQRLYVVSYAAAREAEAEANDIVRNLLPTQVVEHIISGRDVHSLIHKDVAILYADLVGFTKLSSTMQPVDLMQSLNAIYSQFDKEVESHAGLWKVETIGDAYIVVGGLFDVVDDDIENPTLPGNRFAGGSPVDVRARMHKRSQRARDHLESILTLASSLHSALDQVRKSLGLEIHMRIGVHCGDVVTGIVGSHRPRFSVLGLSLMVAEAVEAMADKDTTMCTLQAQAAYLSSGFLFAPAATQDSADCRRLWGLLSHDGEGALTSGRNSRVPLSGRSAVTVSTGRSGNSTARVVDSSRVVAELSTSRKHTGTSVPPCDAANEADLLRAPVPATVLWQLSTSSAAIMICGIQGLASPSGGCTGDGSSLLP